MSFRGFISCQTGAGRGRLAHPLSVLPTEELRRSWPRPLLGGVLHADALRLLDQSPRDGLRKGGQSADQTGTLLKEDPDGQQSHAGALSLEGQVETSLGQWTQSERLHVKLTLTAFPQQEVCSHRVHLRQEEDRDWVNMDCCCLRG